MAAVKPAVGISAAAGAISIAVISYFLLSNHSSKLRLKQKNKNSANKILNSKKKKNKGLISAIGSTPLVRINSLSDATGCEILGKAEFLNPGGSVKDRVAVKIIEEALASGQLVQGGVVTEGSAGSTAVSLATVAPAYGCKCHVVIPDDAAIEKISDLGENQFFAIKYMSIESVEYCVWKYEAIEILITKVEKISRSLGESSSQSQILEALGATVERVRPVSITHRDHFVNIARRRASEATKLAAKQREASDTEANDLAEVNHDISWQEECLHTLSTDCKGGFFADQFENLANFRAHYEGTGPEIWNQTGGKLHAFIAAAGTGGTLAGVSHFLKEKNPSVKCYLIDPPGSGLFNKVTRGVMYTKEEAEGKRLKNPFDTITEGIGINRLTKNFMMAELDGAYRGTDKEAVEMSRFLLRNDGLFVGSSSAMNCVGAVKLAQALGPGHTIVTILCDSGIRHLSKFYNPQYLAEYGLTPSATGLEFLDPSLLRSLPKI